MSESQVLHTVTDPAGGEAISSTELVEYILARYHRPLDRELPRLQGLARKVFERHGDTHRGQVLAVLHAFTALREQLEDHMRREEQSLFPWICAGQRTEVEEPFQILKMEHESERWLLQRIRALANDFTLPADASEEWQALWEGLEKLEADLLEHTCFENEVLFPSVMNGG